MRGAGWLVRAWHPSSPIPAWLLALLVILATHNVAQLVAARPGPDQAVDFRPLYLGASVMLDGGNPYDDQLLKQTWIDAARREGFTGLSMPGLPETPLVYPPWALPLFVPLTALAWLDAVPLWYALLAALLPASVLLLAGVARSTPRIVAVVDLSALALAFKIVDWAALVGQPLFLCLALGFASWQLLDCKRPLAAGVLLGLATFKIHLAPAFAALALFRREPRTLVAAVLTIAILSGVFVALCDQPITAVASLSDNLSGRRQAIYDPAAEGYPLSRRIVWSTSVAALAELYVPAAWRYSVLLDAALLAALLPFWIRPLALGRVSAARAFSLFAVVTLLTTSHYQYDCLILLPLYLVARETHRSERMALLGAGAVFLTPINGLLALFDVPEALGILYFNVQVGLLALAAILTWGALTTRGQRQLPSPEPQVSDIPGSATRHSGR